MLTEDSDLTTIVPRRAVVKRRDVLEDLILTSSAHYSPEGKDIHLISIQLLKTLNLRHRPFHFNRGRLLANALKHHLSNDHAYTLLELPN